MSDIDDVYGAEDSESVTSAARGRSASSVQSSLYRFLGGSVSRSGKVAWDAVWLAREGDGGKHALRGRNARDRLSRLGVGTLRLIVDACRKLEAKPGKLPEVLAFSREVRAALSGLLAPEPAAVPALSDDAFRRRAARMKELCASGMSADAAGLQATREIQ